MFNLTVNLANYSRRCCISADQRRLETPSPTRTLETRFHRAGTVTSRLSAAFCVSSRYLSEHSRSQPVTYVS